MTENSATSWRSYATPTIAQLDAWQARHGFSDEQAWTWLRLESGEADDERLPRARFYLFTLAAHALHGTKVLDEWAGDADIEHERDRVTPWAAYFWQYANISMEDKMFEGIERELVAITAGPQWWEAIEAPDGVESGEGLPE